jgi:hypothetical protein
MTAGHHDHDHRSELSEMQLRVRALETILTEKGYIDPAALDLLIETYEKKIGPRNGASVVAKAWVDPQFRRWLFKDGAAAVESLGYGGNKRDPASLKDELRHQYAIPEIDILAALTFVLSKSLDGHNTPPRWH